ncbi:MAG: hypothetical protein NTX45_24040 [Proteobacteria bacterium]|nr:hypothetical protein [Pseudomonadota bacterium]
MMGSPKTKATRAFRELIYTAIFVFIVSAGVLTFATKTDNFLRDMLIMHSDFIDPSSAIFRNVNYSSSSIFHGDTWCGEINAKNQMGGYVGWRPFKIELSKNGDVSVSVRKPEEMPFGSSDDKLDILELFSGCRYAKPAPLWAPLW